MSVINTHAHVLIEQAAEESRREADLHDRPAASEHPTVPDLLQRVLPEIFFVPVAGPPVILLLGPWLLLVLLLIPPAAFLITLLLVLVAGAGVLVALGALIASPYLLVRHLHARRPGLRRRLAVVHRDGQPVSQPAAARLAHLTIK